MPEEITKSELDKFLLPTDRQVTEERLAELYADFEAECRRRKGISQLTRSFASDTRIRLMRCLMPISPLRGGIFRVIPTPEA